MTHARTTDPTSSEDRVTDIVAGDDRIRPEHVIEACREAAWTADGRPRFFTDTDIKSQYDAIVGHPNTTRNDLARHRLDLEQADPPTIVRDVRPRPPHGGGRPVLHFRLARHGDTPRPALPKGRKPKAGDRVDNGGEPGVLVTCPTCSGDGLLHQPDSHPDLNIPMPTDEVTDPTASDRKNTDETGGDS